MPDEEIRTMQATPVDLTTKVQTISDMMIEMQTDMQAIRSGEMKEGTARLLIPMHRNKLRAVDAILAAARIDVGIRAQLAARIGRVTEPSKGEPLRLEKTGS